MKSINVAILTASALPIVAMTPKALATVPTSYLTSGIADIDAHGFFSARIEDARSNPTEDERKRALLVAELATR